MNQNNAIVSNESITDGYGIVSIYSMLKLQCSLQSIQFLSNVEYQTTNIEYLTATVSLDGLIVPRLQADDPAAELKLPEPATAADPWRPVAVAPVRVLSDSECPLIICDHVVQY